MVKAVFDTCILIDYLNGIENAKLELSNFPKKAISVITWMEVMVGTNQHTESQTANWLSLTFEVIELNKAISESAVSIRKSRRIKLPDAIILASAQYSSSLFITRNTKDFDETTPGIRVPYNV